RRSWSSGCLAQGGQVACTGDSTRQPPVGRARVELYDWGSLITIAKILIALTGVIVSCYSSSGTPFLLFENADSPTTPHPKCGLTFPRSPMSRCHLWRPTVVWGLRLRPESIR